MADPFGLDRFVAAQAGIYEQALAELCAGRKASHWMWFVFPQLRGLAPSPTSVHFGIASADEARAYLAHSLLGSRLAACTAAMLSHHGRTARQVLGEPDDLKFRSSMTLFAHAAADAAPFEAALARYFGGAADPRTLAMLG